MSTGSKITLALSCAVTTGIVIFVQYSQVKERKDRRVRVEIELKEIEERRLMNAFDLRQQQALTEKLKQLEQEELSK